jgi:uncharacterized phage infection (PIP) family protein YhgE
MSYSSLRRRVQDHARAAFAKEKATFAKEKATFSKEKAKIEILEKTIDSRDAKIANLTEMHEQFDEITGGLETEIEDLKNRRRNVLADMTTQMDKLTTQMNELTESHAKEIDELTTQMDELTESHANELREAEKHSANCLLMLEEAVRMGGLDPTTAPRTHPRLPKGKPKGKPNGKWKDCRHGANCRRDDCSFKHPH